MKEKQQSSLRHSSRRWFTIESVPFTLKGQQYAVMRHNELQHAENISAVFAERTDGTQGNSVEAKRNGKMSCDRADNTLFLPSLSRMELKSVKITHLAIKRMLAVLSSSDDQLEIRILLEELVSTLNCCRQRKQILREVGRLAPPHFKLPWLFFFLSFVVSVFYPLQ